MFAQKPRMEIVGRALLIAVMLFSALSPTTTSANSLGDIQETKPSTDTSNDIASGLTLGKTDPGAYGNVPILSEQIAQQAQQQEEKPVGFKAWAEPAIYIPGKPISLNWKVQNLKAGDVENAEVVIQAPAGLTTADINPTYTQDGLVSVSLKNKKDSSVWNAAEDAELPIYLTLDLLVNDDLVASETVMIDQAGFSVEKNKSGKLNGLNGKVEVEVPATAMVESLDFDIREPAPQTLPGVALTWQPLEIIAVGKDSQKNVDKFNTPIKIKIKYDEAQIFNWDENALAIYYYDEDLLDWFPLDTTVDTKNNTLVAYSDHLTVFDYKANNWQSQSLPTVDSFKVSDFTGAGTYGINIWTPPGPGGLQPSLALSYNSQVVDDSSAYSQPSWVGLGWDLDTGAINRNMHGTDSDGSDDTFSISAGGVSGLLLPISINGNITTYNTADQSFMKVEFDSSANKWTAWGTDGTKYEFASIARTSTTDTDGCAAAGQLNMVWRWSLTTITDTHGNQLSYTYDVETKPSCYNEIAVYPLSISYPNGKYSVSFVTETRLDYQTSWQGNSSKTLYGTKRLKEIKIQNLGATVRRYAFSYAPNNETVNVIYPSFTWSAGGKTSTLVGVQEFANDTSSPALPAVTFTYGDNMHITNVNNGQGGQVAMTYEIWQYLDDYNENIRSLFERFGYGLEQCYYGFGPLIDWTKVGTGTVKCGSDQGGLLNLGNYTTGTTGRTRRSLPEHIAKPGGRYQFAITVSSQASGQATYVEWGVADTSPGGSKNMLSRTVGYGLASAEDSIDIPASYNFASTQLEMYCQRCFISKVEFMQLPRLYRVTQRTVTVQPTGVISTYTYNYDNAAPVSVDNSAAAASGGTLYSPILREFRGHVMSQVVNPDGLATVNWFYQTDTLKGRAYDTFVLKRDFFDVLDTINSNWVTSGGTHSPELMGEAQAVVDFDYAIRSVNSAANWNVSFSRAAASLTSGDVAVAQVRLSGTNAQGEVGLVNGGQFFGLTMQGNTATASNGTVLLNGNFLKDEWYGVMFFVDAVNGSRVRIWQLDNPDNFGETVISGVGSGSWAFRDRVYSGTIWLDSYFEGIPYSETITRYTTTVQYDTVAGNGIPDLAASGLLTYRDLQIAWNTVTSVEQRNYNGDAKFVGTKQEFTYDTASNYGNLLTQKAYAGDNGTWTLYRGSKSEYFPNATAYIVSLPARQVTLDCQSGSCDFAGETGKIGESILFYDNSTAYTSPPIKGDVTMQRAWVEGNNYSQVSMGYDTYGNVTSQTAYTGYATATQTTNPSGAQTTTTQYNDGGYNTYPTKVINALSQETTTAYNFGLGLPTSVTDPNLVTTSATYDGFGRMLTITAPGDAAPTLQVTYYDTRIPFQIDLIQQVNAGASIRLSRFYDGAGRQIQTQTVGAVVNNVQKNVAVNTQFNSAGRAVKQSIPIPYAYDNTPDFIAQDFTQSTTTAYDVLGRTLSVTQPNTNAVTYDYGDLITTVTDPKLYVTSSTMDVWGRTTLVDAPEGPDVTYTYDPLNRLKTAARGGETTTINYDAAGRKLNMDDPDMGYWVYQYDALGNLKFQTDARGCVLTLGYDSLNRLLSKTSSGAGCGTQVNTSYTYDVGTNGKGRRTSMNDDSGSAAWTYDARGRVTQENKVISDQSFSTAWTYNSADLPVTMTYPDNEVLTYGYNSDGSLDTVMSSLGDTYVADTQYDEAGRITSMDYGASILRKTFNYFPWNTTTNGGLLNTATTTRLTDQTTLQNFAYTYDKNANVSTIMDNIAGPQTQAFGYDSLNRLTSAEATGGTNGLYSESYSYSASTGNLSVKAGVTYTYDPNHPHAVASLSNGNNYAYDANGNMIDRNADGKNFDLAYDAENRMVSVTTGTGGFEPSGALAMSHPHPNPLPQGEGIGRAREVNQPLQQSGFPSTSVLDNFNRADGAIGSNWTGQNTSSFTIASNQLAINAGGLDSYVAWIPASFGADQEAYVTLSQVSANGLQQGLLLKAASNGTAAIKVVYVAATDVVRVFTYTTAQGWVQRGADISVTMNNGDQFGARALANGDVEVYKNGSLLATRDVTAWAPYTGGGLIGLWYSNVSSATVDDFGGGDVVSGPTATPTVTSTPTRTPTVTNTSTVTQTPTVTRTPTRTNTPTNTPLATNTPTKTSTPASTPTATQTPTRTPTATATPTRTNTPTVTPTPSTPSFTSATFLYDGDGKRVKSIMNMGVGTNTTYFVGAHFEVVETYTGTQVNKYYYAGAQRIALRTDGTLNYLLGDHLGSTSLTTDANGTVISEMRYKAWGETRYASGIIPTQYQYTGQYSYAADFGLMFYNARWYDSSLSRFAQADTVVPGGIQGLDRYAYVGNSPVRYTDPSGHEPGGCQDSAYINGSWVCNPTLQQVVGLQLAQFGITTNNGTLQQNQGTLQAAELAGNKLATTLGGGISAQEAFLRAHGNISITFGANTNYCETNDHSITCGAVNEAWFVQAMIHEFGHVFDNQFEDIVGRPASDYPENRWDATFAGYKDDDYPSMQHPFPKSGARGRDEDLADMYLNWVLDMNPAYSENGFTTDEWGNKRRDMMNNTVVDGTLRGMPVWLQLMGLR